MYNDYGKIIIPFSGSKETYELPKGYWRFELWGAASGSSNYKGQSPDIGLGAYVSGELSLYHSLVINCYVGGKGGNNQGQGKGGTKGFNGGSEGGNDNINYDCGSGGSGGATDVRLSDDLSSRIIVAGGGGSPGCHNTLGGAGGSGGTISGNNGSSNKAGTIMGGKGGYINVGSSFGDGQKGADGNEAGGSGGGGYFGGEGGNGSGSGGGGSGGGGGSSYASGCNGCVTLLTNNVLGKNIHPSSLIFHNITMIAGNETSFPTFTHSTVNYIPHNEDGLIVITKLWDIFIYTCKHSFINQKFFRLLLFITIYLK